VWRAAGGRARMTQLDEPDAQPPDVEPMELWRAAVAGSHTARERLLEMCYSELRMLARRMLAGDSISCRLQPTDLANEAALRVLKLDHMQWNDRAHFLATAATVMRQALIDEVRRFRAGKRQMPPILTTLVDTGAQTLELDLEQLDSSLSRLAEVSPERARLVELRFFVGLTIEATAGVLAISPATVKRRWDASRAWLLRDMSRA
jgi:RNA polymerase sigma factor (TIGR02999 family)